MKSQLHIVRLSHGDNRYQPGPSLLGTLVSWLPFHTQTQLQHAAFLCHSCGIAVANDFESCPEQGQTLPHSQELDNDFALLVTQGAILAQKFPGRITADPGLRESVVACPVPDFVVALSRPVLLGPRWTAALVLGVLVEYETLETRRTLERVALQPEAKGLDIQGEYYRELRTLLNSKIGGTPVSRAFSRN